MRSTPLPTAIALLGTLAATSGALAVFLAGTNAPAEAFLLLFTALFCLRVAGQIVVVLFHPWWLPPAEEWNFVPYRLLLPAQLVIVALMTALVARRVEPGPAVAQTLVVSSFAYGAAMAIRYSRRMLLRPDQRWLGGAIPIVFHCVLAAFVFVLGVTSAA